MPNEWVNMKRLKSNFAGRMGPNFLALSVVTRLWFLSRTCYPSDWPILKECKLKHALNRQEKFFSFYIVKNIIANIYLTLLWFPLRAPFAYSTTIWVCLRS